MDEMIEKRAAFKIGFLTKLSELGITPDQLFDKVAILDSDRILSGIASLPGAAINKGMSLGGTGWDALKDLLVSGPIYAGSAAGMAHGALEAPSDSGIKSLQKVEELATLQRLSREINERRKRNTNDGAPAAARIRR